MRAPEQLLAEMSLTAASSDLPLATVHIPAASPSWFVGCHGPPYNLALIVPSALFVAYLGWLARKSFLKLTSGQSHLMVSYYALLWLVSLLNLFWCLVQHDQVWQCTAAKESAWNMLSLFTETGMLFMEISLLAFLLQGSHAGGLDVLTRTFVVSGVIVAADTLLKLLILYTLAARPSFYNYVCAMLLLNSMSLFGCLLASNGSGFGIWLFNLTTVCYHSLYLPLLYVVFLADFFQEEDMRLENVYYSEMKDAGFFDDDWD
ncbi:hypothetical protein ZIOFF_012750 [Zingiber officinale]|uniref:Transmembrane protein adipocyte-associated 1 n=1 Tax=Zingiber officinale TaxID=94328 RepID=A0A8J5I804_ZINOF|nr:hypothetical protein ZIOFF_012750 [Zingiber officinale]